ncbi:MAG: hypothetical protein ACYCO3_07685 [Mycobacteriales bacterium]
MSAAVRGAARRRFLARLIGLLLSAGLVVAGCSSVGHVHLQRPRASDGPNSPSPTAVAEARALEQYTAFWPLLGHASRAKTAAQKRAILAPYAADPALTSIVNAFIQQNERGQVVYGTDVVHPEIVSFSLSRGLAVIRDCQNSSRSGIEVAATGKPVTVGPPRNPVDSTMHLIAGTWRIVFIQHPGGTC